METLTILEDYISEFSGAVIAVSHDRYFLDKIAQSILYVGENGAIARSMGGYSDYLLKREMEQQPAQTRAEKAAPRRSESVRRLKFTFNEEREFKSIDADIARLEAQIAECDAQIALNASDYQKLEALGAEKQALEEQLDQKTERWVYLNDLAERIAAQEK